MIKEYIRPLLIGAFIITGILTSTAQQIDWQKTIDSPLNNSTMVYIGENSNGHLFYYGKDQYAGRLKGLNKIKLLYITNSMEMIKTEQEMKLEGEILYTAITEENITLITEESRKNDREHEITLTILHPTRFNIIKQKVLFISKIKYVEDLKLNFATSEDGSKILMSRLQVHEISNKGGLRITVFDQQFNVIWKKMFKPYLDVPYSLMSLLDYEVSNEGVAYVLFSSYESFKKGRTANHYMHISMMDDEDESVYTIEQEVKSIPRAGKMIITKENTVYISAYFDENYMAAIYDIENEDLISISKSNKVKGYRSMIDDMILLPNGNVITLGKLGSVTWFEGSNRADFSSTYIFITCMDETGDILYDKMIPRAAYFSSGKRIKSPPYIHYNYIMDGNILYLLYNDHLKNENLPEHPKKNKSFSPEKSGSGAMYITTVDADGVMNRGISNSYKKDYFIYHPLSFKLDNGAYGLVKLSRQKMTLGKFEPGQ